MLMRKGFMTAILLSFVAAGAAAGGSDPMTKATEEAKGKQEKATFAGGCFWCMEEAFEKLPGVITVTSGYIGGKLEKPTYQQVSAGGTGHAEAIQVVYDPAKVGYDKLLDAFWRNIDPTVRDRQFCDVGSQYRSGIFFHSEEQRLLALKSREALEKSKPFKGPIVTEITKAGEFYTAEEYHQDYYKKNPLRYSFYKTNCGRENRLKQLWDDKTGH